MEIFISSAIGVIVGFITGGIVFYFYGKSAQAKIFAEAQSLGVGVKKVL